MPYTRKQCRLFGAKQGRGESVPRDWKAHCAKPARVKSRANKTRKR